MSIRKKEEKSRFKETLKLAFFFSNAKIGFVLVQGGKTISKTASEHQSLPCDKHFQTDALQLALLTQVGKRKVVGVF